MNIKHFLLGLIAFIFIGQANAQIHNPVSWEYGIENNEFVFTATIEEGWHVYSQHLPPDDGPIPTSFNFDANENLEIIGKAAEGKAHTEFDPNFQMELAFFSDKAVFRQKAKASGDKPFTVKGFLEFMVCDDEMCLPPEMIDFEFEVDPKTFVGSDNSGDPDEEGSRTPWGIFIAGFLGGLLALLTPCVFPMIPLTVSFFTKQSKNKAKGVANAIIYGLSIIAIYVLLGFGVTKIFGADALNALSTNVWFNLSFFVLLVVFAASFLGAFEIRMPSSWINKADTASDKGGLLGIFFMAFTLSLVSFSCTGPIIGTLLVEAAVNGGYMGPIVGMIGFSTALALPFALFAAFPGWLNGLPQSGGWLNSVKVVLGFLELALAFKFLSNADLVVQAHILTREVFLVIWIVIFLLMSLYLLGAFRFAHDSPMKHLSITRLTFAMLSLFMTIYLIPGLFGAPLKIISGFPPPMFYSESPKGVGYQPAPVMMSGEGMDAATAERAAHCPHGLNCFHDYEEGLAYAKEVGKPIMLDFTGWACVNCRKMEEQVWSDPEVLNRLRNEFVLISLYVDEKTALPEDEQIEVTIGDKTKKLRTVGNKWSHMQADVYKTNSQPYYVILNHKEEQLGISAAYDSDIQKYVDWLDTGLEMFK
ncbi:MAG: thiol:disulfide interchange protein [Flavobacteriales bacterium]|jgi:thiol:disulfide interchange protein